MFKLNKSFNFFKLFSNIINKSESNKSILESKEKMNDFTIWTRDIHKYLEWSPSCSPKKYLSIVESR